MTSAEEADVRKRMVIVSCVTLLAFASGCGTSTAGSNNGTSAPSTAPARSTACSTKGAVVVNLPELGTMASRATVNVGQEIWVVYTDPHSSSTGRLTDAMSYPVTWGPASFAVHAICNAATDQTIGTLFRAEHAGQVEILAGNRCFSGCAAMASIALVTIAAA